MSASLRTLKNTCTVLHRRVASSMKKKTDPFQVLLSLICSRAVSPFAACAVARIPRKLMLKTVVAKAAVTRLTASTKAAVPDVPATSSLPPPVTFHVNVIASVRVRKGAAVVLAAPLCPHTF